MSRIDCVVDMLWPVMAPDQLLSVEAADAWEAKRTDAGIPTSYADHAAARVHHNDFIVGLASKEMSSGNKFHRLYETNKTNRNKLLSRYIRDLKRTVSVQVCSVSF